MIIQSLLCNGIINYEVMTDPQEQENYLRMLFLVFDVGTSAKRSILANHLIKNGLNSFKDFIDKNQHDIYHYFDNRKCCLCTKDMSSTKTVLLPHQIQLIFDINRNQRKCGHRYGTNNRFCCLTAANISLNELDFTLLRFFIINFCDDMIWDDCLQSYNNNFETFLEREKHYIFHMWKPNTACCLCRTGFVQPKQYIQSDKQYHLLFQFKKNSCNDDTCGYSVMPGLTYDKLKNDDKLLFINLTNAFCPLRKAIETITTARNSLAHALQLRLDQTLFERSWNDVSDAIERIAFATNTLNDVRKNISDIKEQHFDVRLCLHKLENMLRENQNMQDVSEAIENLVEDLKETCKRLSQLEETVQHNTDEVQHNTEAVQQITESVQQNTEAVLQNKETTEKMFALIERMSIEARVLNGNRIEITTQDPPAAMTPSVMSAVWASASNVIGWCCFPAARKILYKKDEDEDSFKCGPCRKEFNRIQDFLAHKDLCVRRTKSKKYTYDSSNTSADKDKYLKVTVEGIGETWEKQTVEYSKENVRGLNVDGAEVLCGELGSLIVWIKSSAKLAGRSGFVSLANSFLKNLFMTCPVEENKTILVEVNIEIFEEISDADMEGDIYRCGQCNYECSSFTSFLKHKTDKCQTSQENSNPNKIPFSDISAGDESFLDVDVEEKEAAILNLKKELHKSKTEAEELRKSIERAKTELTQKLTQTHNEELANVQQELQRKQTTLENLVKQLQESKSETADLLRQNNELEELKMREQDVNKKDTRIAILTKELQESKSEVEELRKDVVEKETTIVNLEKELQKYNTEAEELQKREQAVNKKDTCIANFTKGLQESKSEVGGLRKMHYSRTDIFIVVLLATACPVVGVALHSCFC